MLVTLPFLLPLLAGFTDASIIPRIPGLTEPIFKNAAQKSSAAAPPSIWKPPMKSGFQWILSGIPDIDAANPSIHPNAGVYEVDLFYNTNQTIRLMKQLGQKVICYFSAATAENWRDDYSQFDSEDMGAELHDWPGERYLDIRKPKVFEVISKRIQLASEKGCDGIEPDNVDVYSNDNGFRVPITQGDSVDYIKKLSNFAHNLSLSVGIKNCIEILGPIYNHVDYAISEECVIYSNCTAYANFTSDPTNPALDGKPVFEIEYVNYTYSGDYDANGKALDPSQFEISNDAYPGLTGEALRKKLCSLDHAGATMEKPWLKLNPIIKTVDLNGWIMYCDGNVEVTKTKDVSTRGGRPTGVSRPVYRH